MNPFANFAYVATPGGNSEQENSDSYDINAKVIDAVTSTECETSNLNRKRRTESPVKSCSNHKVKDNATEQLKKKKKANKSSPEIMANFWIELKGLTTNYPFAVLLTGVLGAQTRDVVTVGVMKNLASFLGGDIHPLNIYSKSFDELESCIKRLNYCHKKTTSMLKLAEIFRKEPVPSTMHGLKTIPGVGPVISEIILRVAFGVNNSESSNDEQVDGIFNTNVANSETSVRGCSEEHGSNTS